MSVATAAKPLPTAEQLKAYADQLPEIYRDVLSAFATAYPPRLAGEGLTAGTIAAHLHGQGARRQPEEVTLALRRLAEADLLTDDGEFFDLYTPTPLGEELVGVLTGRPAKRVTVPDLPKPTW